jgi:hypothetical protein
MVVSRVEALNVDPIGEPTASSFLDSPGEPNERWAAWSARLLGKYYPRALFGVGLLLFFVLYRGRARRVGG